MLLASALLVVYYSLFPFVKHITLNKYRQCISDSKHSFYFFIFFIYFFIFLTVFV